MKISIRGIHVTKIEWCKNLPGPFSSSVQQNKEITVHISSTINQDRLSFPKGAAELFGYVLS